MPTPQIIKLSEFLLNHISQMHTESGMGPAIDLPHYDMCPRDYLEAAESGLNSTTKIEKTDCVMHMKQAMECQLNTLFDFFNLSVFKKRNLKLEKQLSFLHEAGVFNRHSLVRLNAMRNKVEHEHVVPNEDLFLYYDLVSAFISVCEHIMGYLRFSSMAFDIYNDKGEPIGGLTITYERSGPTIRAEWEISNATEYCTANMSNHEEFAYLFRVFLLLPRKDFLSLNYVVSQVNKVSS